MMALRHRLTILTAGTVGVTVVLVSLVAYLALRSELRGKVDQAITAQYQQFRVTGRLAIRRNFDFPVPTARDGDPFGPVQVIDVGGAVFDRSEGDLTIPIERDDRDERDGHEHRARGEDRQPVAQRHHGSRRT